MSIITPNKFALIIEDIVRKKRISYMDAVIEYCAENQIDPSTTKSMINKNLKEKIAYEAQGLNMLKEKTAKYQYKEIYYDRCRNIFSSICNTMGCRSIIRIK